MEEVEHGVVDIAREVRTEKGESCWSNERAELSAVLYSDNQVIFNSQSAILRGNRRKRERKIGLRRGGNKGETR